MLLKGEGMTNASTVQWKKSLQYPERMVKDVDDPVIMGVYL